MKTDMPSESHPAKHFLISLLWARAKLMRWVGRKDLDKAPGKAAWWGGLAGRITSSSRLISVPLSCHFFEETLIRTYQLSAGDQVTTNALWCATLSILHIGSQFLHSFPFASQLFPQPMSCSLKQFFFFSCVIQASFHPAVWALPLYQDGDRKRLWE